MEQIAEAIRTANQSIQHLLEEKMAREQSALQPTGGASAGNDLPLQRHLLFYNRCWGISIFWIKTT